MNNKQVKRRKGRYKEKEPSSAHNPGDAPTKLDCHPLLERFNVSYNEFKYHEEFITFTAHTIKCHT